TRAEAPPTASGAPANGARSAEATAARWIRKRAPGQGNALARGPISRERPLSTPRKRPPASPRGRIAHPFALRPRPDTRRPRHPQHPATPAPRRFLTRKTTRRLQFNSYQILIETPPPRPAP